MTRIVLAAADMTDQKAAERVTEQLLADKVLLNRELQHQVANIALFYQPEKWITIDAEYTRSRARFTDQPVGLDRIPGAIEQVLAGGLVVQHGPLTASLRARHFGSFPLIEDNSRRSSPTTVVNARLAYRFDRFQLSAEVINLLNSRDNDITYFYTSRLQGEPLQGVDDYHVHPIEPRELRVSTTVHF